MRWWKTDASRNTEIASSVVLCSAVPCVYSYGHSYQEGLHLMIAILGRLSQYFISFGAKECAGCNFLLLLCGVNNI